MDQPPPIWLLGPNACPVPLAEAKKEPKGGWLWWTREGSDKWQPIGTLAAEIGKATSNGKAKQ